jgi:hypothetical protein
MVASPRRVLAEVGQKGCEGWRAPWTGALQLANGITVSTPVLVDVRGEKKLVGALRVTGPAYFAREPRIWQSQEFPLSPAGRTLAGAQPRPGDRRGRGATQDELVRVRQYQEDLCQIPGLADARTERRRAAHAYGHSGGRASQRRHPAPRVSEQPGTSTGETAATCEETTQPGATPTPGRAC